MQTKHFAILVSISFLIIASVVFADQAFGAESAANIQYPVAELGNCKSESDCKIYCDKPENMTACLDFAKENNLMSEEEIELAEKFLAIGSKGPGGCTSKDTCEEYCNNINHINECITFAEKNGLMSPTELEEAKKVQSAIARGVKPPSCGNKKDCDIYCEDSNHMEECITFAEAAGFIQGKELEDAKKMLAAIKRGVKPPPCNGKEACDEYCSKPENMELCMNFAMEAGFMSEEEKADAQKMLEALRKGAIPPNCKGKEECDIYCGQEEHFEECIAFSVAAGFMTEEEAAMARKTGGKGPGGCISKEECEAFCNNPDNQQTCFDFSKENGLISAEDLARIEEGTQRFKESVEQAPPEVLECLNSQIGADMVEKLKNGTAMPSQEIGDKMRLCFEQMGSQQPGAPGEGGMMPPAGQTGPGGCQTQEECQTYCQNNPTECQNFQAPTEGSMPNQPVMPTGPGGCPNPEECESYCQTNPEACQNFSPQPGPQPGEPMMPGEPTGSGTEMMPPGDYQPPQYQQPQEGTYPPPEGNYPPPEGSYPAPAPNQPELQYQPTQQLPPVEQQPPSSEPSGLLKPESLLGSILYIFLRLLSR